jgi:hypothetical protein
MDKLWKMILEIKTEEQEIRSMSRDAVSATDIKFKELTDNVSNMPCNITM